jgi:hypothetical protein
VNVPYDHSSVATSALEFQLPAKLKVSACSPMLDPMVRRRDSSIVRAAE